MKRGGFAPFFIFDGFMSLSTMFHVKHAPPNHLSFPLVNAESPWGSKQGRRAPLHKQKIRPRHPVCMFHVKHPYLMVLNLATQCGTFHVKHTAFSKNLSCPRLSLVGNVSRETYIDGFYATGQARTLIGKRPPTFHVKHPRPNLSLRAATTPYVSRETLAHAAVQECFT